MILRRFLLPILLLFSLLACSREPAQPLDCSAKASLPSSVEEVEGQRAHGGHFSNAEIRARYVCAQQRIASENERWKAEGVSLEARARKAYEMRHEARLVARAMMSDPLEIKALQARDQAKYGNPDGPTLEWLVKDGAARGMTGDAVYEDIIKSSQRTDERMNRAVLP